MRIDPKYKALCFDMDATLVDTKLNYSKLSELVAAELIKIGIPLQLLDPKKNQDENLAAVMTFLKEQGRADEIFSVYDRVRESAKRVEMEDADKSKPFRGTSAILIKAHELGLKTGLLTRGYRVYAEKVTEHCGICDLLDAVVARDDYPEKEVKPAPIAMQHLAEKLGIKTEEILFFGDHESDFQCARDSGAGFIGVLTGTTSKEDWNKMGVTAVYPSISEFCDEIE